MDHLYGCGRFAFSIKGHICFLYSFNSDITALAKDRAYAQIRLDEMSIHQVIS